MKGGLQMENKVAFIICVSDEKEYEECTRYIERIIIPEGFEIEIIAVRNLNGIASAYNSGMKQSNAKYKVYIHQDTIIVNKMFIFDVLSIFNDSNIGMIGVIGCENILTNAVWCKSDSEVGKIYERSSEMMILHEANEVTNEEKVKNVQALDGVIMITQYDIPWRVDLFDGNYFYDISQCIEYKRNNLRVVVPYQQNPWCLCDNKRNEAQEFDIYRNVFLKEYSKDLFPLVSILIPTYNRAEYFEQALISALNQSYLNIEIIVGDNSDNDDTKKICERYIERYENIKYIKNTENLGMNGNIENLYEQATGRYINYLLDDDLFERNKIETMMNYFIKDRKSELSFISSNRKIIDDNGNICGNFIPDESVQYFCDFMWQGRKLIDSVILLDWNFIGEPTTVLFDKSKLKETFGRFNGQRFVGILDLAAWYNLLLNGNAILLSEPLSSFRIHNNQEQQNVNIIISSIREKLYVIKNAKEYGILSDKDDYKNAIKRLINSVVSIEKSVGNINELNKIVTTLNRMLNEEEI